MISADDLKAPVIPAPLLLFALIIKLLQTDGSFAFLQLRSYAVFCFFIKIQEHAAIAYAFG